MTLRQILVGYVDNEKVVVMGGSHGGFLTGHLLGQHHDRFKAGVLRNPVLDLALMNQISDIPDWCFVEGYGSQACAPNLLARNFCKYSEHIVHFHISRQLLNGS